MTSPTRAAPAPRPAGPAATSSRTPSRTPRRLRLAAAVAALSCLAVGVAALVGSLAQAAALQDAVADTDQQIRALEVRNDLVAADALATNAFLVGGLEPTEQRARYDAGLASAAAGVTAVSGADASDAAALGDVNGALGTYAGLVEQARANNRQGFPVGAAYLEAASSGLRTDALPGLDAVVQVNADRVGDAFGTASVAQVVLVVVVGGAVVLLGVQVWLARRTRRRLNRGLVLATLLVVVAWVTVASSLQDGATAARQVRDGSYARTVAVAQAFSLANDAKAMESFTLIKRGSGQAYEESYQESVAQARAHLRRGADAAVVAAFETWAGRHAEIRALDDEGDWDGAVALTTSTAADAPNAAFDAFSSATLAAVQTGAATVGDELDDARVRAERTAWAALLACVLAGVAALWGFSARLKEYR
ncbi:hypothetical protein [Cellulomonas gilvus]|uniref:Secreted protein n=1 Tax=Cellulomonas gilvus (strain ATCC 13127 / NRRL B-14078) TaxID=593907 RepID=F8A4D6_CELGA|nr:hypothetical protein [Cellulomonas gilvus]AEI12042.1 hypothetical protein Celgi_1523 [Cellulomonas gilvus ATCC 13127]